MKRLEIATQITASLITHETFTRGVNPYALASEEPHTGLKEMMTGIAKLALAQADILLAEAYPETAKKEPNEAATIRDTRNSGSPNGWLGT